MKTVIMYEPGDLLTVEQAAEHFGYSIAHFRNMLNLHDKAADPRLMRIKIDTDETWRKANRSRARYIFDYIELKEWYEARQRRASVKSKTWARRGTPNPIL